MLVIAFILTLGFGLAMLWAFLGRAIWWVPAFALSFAGGYFNLGIKVYPHEIGMGLSFLALAALLAVNPPARKPRPHLDWSFYALAVYMAVHLTVSCILVLSAGTGGAGTVVRLYANGLWGLVFAALFWRFGDLRHFRLALVLATVFCVVRVAMGALALDQAQLVAAGSDGLFVPPGGLDLRVSALQLIALLVIWFYRERHQAARLLLATVYVGAIYLCWLGASRVAALSAGFTLLLWAIVQRRRAGLVVGAAGVFVAAVIVVAVNVSPAFYDSLPDGTRRSLSAVVATRDLDEHAETAGSNEWHFMLLKAGFDRWTRNAGTILVGNPVEGWSEDYDALPTIEEKVDVAARLATYENAVFTIAATLGLVGLLLWIRAVHWLFRPFTFGILRRGIRGPDDALIFVAVQSLIVYIGFSWIAGGYPSTVCVLGALAGATYFERRARANTRRPAPVLYSRPPRTAS